MSQTRLPWLLAYDVRCPRRLQRLHRRLLRIAAPVQYSVFLLHATTEDMERLMDDLAAGWIAPEDDLRAYPIGDVDSVAALGQPRCPEGWSGWAALTRASGDGAIGTADTRHAQSELFDFKEES
jgi:CRISPR-associated protein Cas2